MKVVLKFGYFIVGILIASLFVIAFLKFGFFEGEIYYAEDFGIDTLISSNDKDNDGIDDYTDILEGAREFVSKKPKYKSKYYAGGYPTDEYAVCTDVIWHALQNAGYDIKEMIDYDIDKNLKDYDIDSHDINIDFRRVRNLKVFFDKYLEKLTIDTSEIESWQPGDIVVYNNHIAIVSDKRNKKGKPYIIHHGGQIRYEENALTKKEIIGHYRFNLERTIDGE